MIESILEHCSKNELINYVHELELEIRTLKEYVIALEEEMI